VGVLRIAGYGSGLRKVPLEVRTRLVVLREATRHIATDAATGESSQERDTFRARQQPSNNGLELTSAASRTQAALAAQPGVLRALGHIEKDEHLVTKRMPRTVVTIAVISALHFVLFLSAWGSAFAQFELGGRSSVAAWLGVLVEVLGFPLLHLSESVVRALRIILPNDTAILLVATTLNSLYWGVALVSAWRLIRRRRGTKTSDDVRALKMVP
jgi:hypothetical protein